VQDNLHGEVGVVGFGTFFDVTFLSEGISETVHNFYLGAVTTLVEEDFVVL